MRKPQTQRNLSERRLERQVARAVGMKQAHYRVLKAIGDAGPNGIGFTGIRDKTGDYSLLTYYCRPGAEKSKEPRHGPSLCDQGLIREEIHDVAGKDSLILKITAKGRQKLQQAQRAEQGLCES